MDVPEEVTLEFTLMLVNIMIGFWIFVWSEKENERFSIDSSLRGRNAQAEPNRPLYVRTSNVCLKRVKQLWSIAFRQRLLGRRTETRLRSEPFALAKNEEMSSTYFSITLPKSKSSYLIIHSVTFTRQQRRSRGQFCLIICECIFSRVGVSSITEL